MLCTFERLLADPDDKMFHFRKTFRRSSKDVCIPPPCRLAMRVEGGLDVADGKSGVFVAIDADCTCNGTRHTEYLLSALSANMNLSSCANPTDSLLLG